MNKARALKLSQHCHDSVVRIKASQAYGKIIPNLMAIEDLYIMMEEVLKHIQLDLEVEK